MTKLGSFVSKMKLESKKSSDNRDGTRTFTGANRTNHSRSDKHILFVHLDYSPSLLVRSYKNRNATNVDVQEIKQSS
ncbi:hypothetical protein HanXRQr2_Chr06g0261661 [Helianthus annuus]|uniref:Uncharacterized protein n=1 Tax=Helianthus annuus TaxID=4232 RepID=A0A251UIM2_HELAN|nr:hypothetical protein HanXRQr2_Chr06g0261661 [Helianthus annuus]KAJ0903744.1 hypothetical protein HanPSC8_Chr07g0273461 [Helianthus annuus]